MKRSIVALCGVAASALVLFGVVAGLDAQTGQWGTVKGRILWGGKDLPERKEIEAVNKNPDKAACCKDGPVLDEVWVVNKKNKGLKWTFVWLANDDPKSTKPLPIHPSLKDVKQKEVVMDQPACMFVPHALGMREGQVLIAKNSASIAHNYKWTGAPTTPNEGGNVLIAPNGQVVLKDFVAHRLPIKIECNIHPWMNGWVRVFNHPYFAVTDADGNFEFKDAPAGKYRLMVWHGSGGWRGGAKGKDGTPITIKSGGVTDLGSLDYPPPAE